MSWNLSGSKKAAILATVLGTFLMGQSAWAADYNTPITGGEDTPYAGIKSGTTYTLQDDSTINVVMPSSVGPKPDPAGVFNKVSTPLDIEMGAHNLTINVSGSNLFLSGVYNSSGAMGRTTSINGTGLLTLNIGDGSMRSMAFGGIGENQHIKVTAPLKAVVGSSKESTGINIPRDTDVSLMGDTEITVNKDAAFSASLFSQSDNSVINVNYAGGAIASPDRKVVLNGDIYTQDVGDGAGTNYHGTINLGLSGKESVLNGVSGYRNETEEDYETYDETVYSPGVVNLALQNGATWNNEKYGTKNNGSEWNGFKGSHVTTLTGGSSDETAGNIFQKDRKPLTIDKLSGTVTLLYAHEGDGSQVANYTSGDTTVTKADAGAKVIMITDNTGIDTGNKEKVAGALDAMAHKFYYTAQDSNLSGTAKIAEGLTVASASKGTGTMAFTGAKGQASVDSSTVQLAGAVTPAQTGPVKTPETFSQDRVVNVAKKNNNYGMWVDGVYSEGDSSAEDPMVVNMNGHSLSITAGTPDSRTVDGIVANDGKGIRIDNAAGKTISLQATGSNVVSGIRAVGPKSSVAIQGPVYISKVESAGMSANGLVTAGKNAKIVVDGPLTIESVTAQGARTADDVSGIAANAEGSSVIVKGPVEISGVKGKAVSAKKRDAVVTISGGTIETEGDTSSDSLALYAHDGIVNVGIADSAAGITPTTTSIMGDIHVDPYFGGGEVNVALLDERSNWTGASLIGVKASGALNLTLQNGGSWTTGSLSNVTASAPSIRVTKVTGGTDEAHAGIIAPKDERPVEIEKYSGYIAVQYDHDEDTPTTITGGDVKIAAATPGSVITAMTDSENITLSDTDTVNKVLNALANKIYYLAATSGGSDLTGKAEIVESLTNPSASMKLGDITFKSEDGQGQHIAAPEPPLPDWHNVPITGNIDPDADPSQKTFEKAGILADGVYTFGEDTTLTAKDSANVVAAQKNVKINAAGHTLTMNQEGRTSATSLISEEEGKNVEITADKLILDNRGTGARAEGIHLAGMNEDGSVTVNGDTEITSVGQGYALGIYAIGKSTVTMNGKVKMNNGTGWAVDANDGGYGYYGASAIYASGNMGGKAGAAKIVLNNDIDLKVNANGLYTNIGGASIDAKGGSIQVKKDSTKPYAALRSEDGEVSMNVVKSGGTVTGADTHKVVIKGNVAVTTGAVYNKDTAGVMTRINLGLSTADSSLTGVIHNAFPEEGKDAGGVIFKGETNLYLQNGATWNNEAYGRADRGFAGSKVTNLTGGSDESKAGVIFQKDTNGITVGNYSGFTKVFYEHEAAGSATAPVTMSLRAAAPGEPVAAPVTFKGGDITIKKAAAGSGIMLVTDNTGITMTDTDSVDATLNALAGKLFYTAHTTGEENLAGKVQIAEGLTASSASVRLEDITYKDENGQGQYIAPEPEPEPEDLPIKAPEVFEKDRVVNAVGDDRKHDSYMSGMYGEKEYTAEDPMVVDMNGHSLSINAEGTGWTFTDGILAARNRNIKVKNDAGKTIDIKVKADSLANGIRLSGAKNSLEIDGPVVIHDIHGTKDSANGVLVSGSGNIVLNGPVTIRDVHADKANPTKYEVSALVNNSETGELIVRGPVDISNIGGSAINAGYRGAKISIGGGRIMANTDTGKIDNLVYSHGGIVNINMADEAKGITPSTLVMEGDIYLDGSGSKCYTNINLQDSESSWKGHIRKNGYFGAEINLHLSNGGTWIVAQSTATGIDDVQVDSIHGGESADKAGVIRPEEEKDVVIANLSGYTKAIYAHEAGAPATILGGNLKVNNAAEGANITLITDNTGLNTASDAKEDKDLVNQTLNALAGKLYYNAYTSGQRNLTGTVQIAEGLTASSVTLKTGDITYKDKNGQGQYIAPVEPEPEPEKDFHNVPITGNTAEDAEPSQKPFVKEGILKDGVYTFDKDTILTAKDTASVVAPQDNVKINAAGHTLTMNQEGRTEATNLINDDQGKTIEITADKLVLDNRGTGARAEGIHLANVNDEGKLTVNGDTEITAEGKGYALGIYALGKSTVTMNGKVKMNNGEGWAVTSGGNAYYDASAVYASGNMGGKEGAAKIALNDDIDLKVNANGLYANIGGASIDAKGGSIELNKSGNGDYSALMASNGTVNMNVVKDGSGNVTGADNHKVSIKGNVTASTSAVFGADKGGKDTRINLGLSTPDSSFTGVVVNQFPVEGKEAQGTTFTGETNLHLENGATWNNEKYGKVNKAWGGPAFAGSDVTHLNGGASADKAGFIRQKDENAITVRNYKGFTKVAYEHDAATPTTIKGGDFNVGKAAAGSGITLMTDNAGLNTASKADADKKLVTDTLTALAGKLKYEAYTTGEKNLAGKVEIAEGLTASSASLDTRDIVFTDEGVGTLAKGEKPGTGSEVTPGGGEQPGGGEIEYGDKETVMMRGAKTALASSAMVWRNTNSDLQQRLGDVRLGREDVGIWAKYKGGKLSMDSQKTDLDAKYNSFSVGFDKEIGDNWLVGGAISHLTGDGTYREGTGDLKQTDFTAYGTRVTEDGQYLDLVAKVGQLKNDFHVVNEMGHKLDGDYKANGMSFSVEYGKRFVQDNGFYIDPSVQFTVGRIGGKDFDAASDFKDGKGGFKSMHIQQDAFTSSVGRLGLTVGQQADNYNAFAKMVLAHEFSGAFDTAFSAEGEAQGSKTHLDLKDTWFELEVGGSAKLSESSYLYGSFARSLGGDVTNKWRVDAGVRFSF